MREEDEEEEEEAYLIGSTKSAMVATGIRQGATSITRWGSPGGGRCVSWRERERGGAQGVKVEDDMACGRT